MTDLRPPDWNTTINYGTLHIKLDSIKPAWSLMKLRSSHTGKQLNIKACVNFLLLSTVGFLPSYIASIVMLYRNVLYAYILDAYIANNVANKVCNIIRIKFDNIWDLHLLLQNNFWYEIMPKICTLRTTQLVNPQYNNCYYKLKYNRLTIWFLSWCYSTNIRVKSVSKKLSQFMQ